MHVNYAAGSQIVSLRAEALQFVAFFSISVVVHCLMYVRVTRQKIMQHSLHTRCKEKHCSSKRDFSL